MTRRGLFDLAVPAGGLCALAGMIVLLLRAAILMRIVVPLAMRLVSADGQIDPDGVEQLGAAVRMVGAGGVAGGLALAAWGLVGRVLPAGLAAPTTEVPEAKRNPVRPLELVAVAGSLIVFATLAWPLMRRGFGYDEIFSSMNFIEVDSVWTTVSTYVLFNNHVAYSLAARLAHQLLGPGEWVARLPALLLALGALVAFWRLARGLVDTGTALFALLLLTISASLLEWGTSARGYSGLLFCALVSSHLYLRLLRRPDTRAAFLFVAVSALGTWFHLYGVWVTGVQALHLLLIAVRARCSRAPFDPGVFVQLWRSLAGVALLTGLLYAPVLPRLVVNVIARRPGAFDADFPLSVVADLSGRADLVMPPLLAVFGLLALMGTVILLKTRRRCGLYVGLLYVVPVGVMWFVAPYDLYPRFFLFLLPWHVLLVALGARAVWDGVTGLRSAPLRRVLTGLLLLLVALWVMLWTVSGRSTVLHEGYRRAAEVLATDRGTDALVCAVGGGAELVAYYLGEPVFVPQTLAEFRARTAQAAEVRLVHRYTPWQSEEHAAIVEWLTRQRVLGRSQGSVPPMRVYVWRP